MIRLNPLAQFAHPRVESVAVLIQRYAAIVQSTAKPLQLDRDRFERNALVLQFGGLGPQLALAQVRLGFTLLNRLLPAVNRDRLTFELRLTLIKLLGAVRLTIGEILDDDRKSA